MKQGDSRGSNNKIFIEYLNTCLLRELWAVRLLGERITEA
jgi:hypothetical protein